MSTIQQGLKFSDLLWVLEFLMNVLGLGILGDETNSFTNYKEIKKLYYTY